MLTHTHHRAAAWLAALALAGCGVGSTVPSDQRDASTASSGSTSTSTTETSTTSTSTSGVTPTDTSVATEPAAGTDDGTSDTTEPSLPSRCSAGRSEADRPDDAPDRYQFRINYVLPADGLDEQLDTNGRISTSIASVAHWFDARSDGARLRFDTCEGALDVRFVQLEATEAELKAEGLYIRDAIEAELKRRGLLHDRKVEGVFYGGDAASTCGGGAWPPALMGRVGAVYLKGSFADPAIPSCASSPVGASALMPGYADIALLHELLHTIGVVASCAPHHTASGHVSDASDDLMYAGSAAWGWEQLDAGHDDYWRHDDPACVDLARSVFLAPLPQNAQLPPGW